jgi:hypothetical protein
MIKNDLAETKSLNGTWFFSLNGKDQQDAIQVPGCWEAQGYSKFDEGPALYQRKVFLPESWEGQTILVEFDAVSYSCEVVINGSEIGKHQGIWTPFTVDLTPVARLGEENDIVLIVYKPGNRFPMRGSLAGFLPDVATTFGGIWQPVRLRAMRFGLDNVQIDTNVDTHQLHIRCRAVTFGNQISNGRWEIKVFSDEHLIANHHLSYENDGNLDTNLFLPNSLLWSPEHPVLYNVQIDLLEVDVPVARVNQKVGFRRLSANGDQLHLNRNPLMMRGILSWGWEPDLIAPAYSREQVREEIRQVKEMGFNLIKLCLFVPNQTYYEVADEEGMLIWQEWPMWLPEITPKHRAALPDEYAEMTRLTSHHPSVVLYSLGCELNRAVDGELLGSLNDIVRGLVSDVLVCDNSGSGESYGGLDYDFSDFTDYHPYFDIHFFEPLLDNWRRDWQTTRPWIFGEFCDSDTFRDIEEIVNANSGSKPWWMTDENPVTTWRSESRALLEEQERLKHAKPGFSPQELVEISYAQSLVVRKYTLELVHRRAGMGGYVVTGLRDTPISTSGIWDDLGRPKWAQTEFLKFNDRAVLSLDVDRRRRWHHGGDRPDRLDFFNLWSETMGHWHVILSLSGMELPEGVQFNWSLIDTLGVEVDGGRRNVTDAILPGAPYKVADIKCQMPFVDRATEFHLNATLVGAGVTVSNDWAIWVYPQLPDPSRNLTIFDPANILDDYGDWLGQVKRIHSSSAISLDRLLLTTGWDDHLQKYLEGGGRVLLLQQGNEPLAVRRCPFWRESVLLFPEHPLWEKFPHRGYADMQFFGIASDVAFDSNKLEQAVPGLNVLRPLLRRLDAREFHMSEYLFEARVGNGMLLGCSLRLQGGSGAQPYGWKRNVAGDALLWALLDYLERA